jgi:hypothetical protein
LWEVKKKSRVADVVDKHEGSYEKEPAGGDEIVFCATNIFSKLRLFRFLRVLVLGASTFF